jgi:DNA-binding GntR family transcriptional regulator
LTVRSEEEVRDMDQPDALGRFVTLGDDESDQVYRSVYRSVLAHQLQPGTKLPEEKLAAIFNVSRTKIRKVLARLEHEQVVEIIHNRGAFVSTPSVEQASDVLKARRIIEPAIARTLAEQASKREVDALRAHVAAERAAVERGDKATYVGLSGGFHNVVAELEGNFALARTLRELTALTCLTILLYDAPAASGCLIEDHALIVDAIERRDPAKAAEVMLRHLKDLENELAFDGSAGEVDLAAIFAR